MALERNNTPSILEEIKAWDTFLLSHNVQAPCFEEESFQEWDILQVNTRIDKHSETGTTSISFSIKKEDNSNLDHIMSLGIFIHNFDNKLKLIESENNIQKLTDSTVQNVNDLVSNAS